MRIESLHALLSHYPDIDGFGEFDDLSLAEAKIRSRLERQDESLWQDADLEALTQLARIQGLQGLVVEAKTMLDRARPRVYPSEDGPATRLQIRYLLEQGRLLCLAMTPVKAQSYFNQALDFALKINATFFAIDAALMLSVSQPPKYKNEQLKNALQMAEQSSDPQAQLWLSHLYVMQGWHAFDFRRYEDALVSFEKALARPRQPGETLKVMVIHWCIARTLRALNRIDEALVMQRELLAQLSIAGQVNGHVFLEIAECLQVLKQPEEARGYFESAYTQLSTDGWYSDNKAADLSRMRHLYGKK
jgi:tetratricopeptide (TPR) repeat protein